MRVESIPPENITAILGPLFLGQIPDAPPLILLVIYLTLSTKSFLTIEMIDSSVS
jgi:hypothetical protein